MKPSEPSMPPHDPPRPAYEETLLTTGQVAAHFGVSAEAVRIWCDSGMVAFQQTGPWRLIPESELAAIPEKRAAKKMAGRRSATLADLAKMTEERDAAMAIVREIAAEYPEHYPQGAETCFYCGAYLDTEPHRPYCVWLRAQQLAAHLPTE